MPTIQIIGDVHGHLDQMTEAIDSRTDFVLQVGDLGIILPTSNLSNIPRKHQNNLGQFAEYFEIKKSFPAPIYFCKGNHEDLQFLTKYDANHEILPNLFYMPNGKILEIMGVRIAFLGGNFSSKWFNQPILSKCQNQKVLGYLHKSEIDRIISFSDKIDILVTHEPSFGPEFGSDRKYGCHVIQALIEAIQPAYAFSGHIHKYAEGRIGKTKCIALGAVNYSDKSSYQISF